MLASTELSELCASGRLVVRALELSEEQADAALAHAAARGLYFAREDLVLGGIGNVYTLEVDGLSPASLQVVREVLARLHTLAADAPELPVLFSSLAFARHGRGRLFLPELAVLKADKGPARAILVTERTPAPAADALRALLASDGLPRRPRLPSRFVLQALESHDAFTARVRAALAQIEHGALQKVVLARAVAVQADEDFDQGDLLSRLGALFPSCAIFAMDGFLGASPELLCAKANGELRAEPLAGTAARSGDPEQDARLAAGLLSSPKERAEHRLVVDAIAEGLAAFVDALEVPSAPHLLELRNVVHLQSLLRGRVRDGLQPEPNVLDVVAALHPTPAVGGVPTEAALSYLAATEPLDRDRYAGPVGYLRADGDGEFYVGIRSAIVKANTARLFAGVGIVAGSDPDAELAETQLKLQALLAAAVRP